MKRSSPQLPLPRKIPSKELRPYRILIYVPYSQKLLTLGLHVCQVQSLSIPRIGLLELLCFLIYLTLSFVFPLVLAMFFPSCSGTGNKTVGRVHGWYLVS